MKLKKTQMSNGGKCRRHKRTERVCSSCSLSCLQNMWKTQMNRTGLLIVLALVLAEPLCSQNVSFTLTNFSSAGDLLVLGETVVSDDGRLFLTYNQSGSTGPYFISRVLHSTPVLMHHLSQDLAASFSTSFTFSIASNQTDITGDGFTFAIVPNNLLPHTQSATAAAMGLFDVDIYKGSNASLQIIAVEYDTFLNLEYKDPDDHHVGLDINALTSTVARSLPSDLVLKTTNFSRRLTSWIDYNAEQRQLDVYLAVAPARKASATKVLSYSPLNIWDYVNSSSYVGFTAGVSVLFTVVVFIAWRRRTTTGLQLDVDLMTTPQKFTYKDLQLATANFKDVLGQGGSGTVYKGIITTNNGGREHVAVKRIAKASKEGEKEFKSEITTIGKLRHRNLVHLIGWCKGQGDLLLVYQYMPNGSLEKLLHSDSTHVLSWPLRYNILKGVAAALVYLHEDWEQMIIHRDIKASNVLLDSDLNARLGDFGLARFFDHDEYCTQASATGIAGTFGYIAPEYAMSARVTRDSDIFSFGVLALEVACGRRPLSRTEESLLDFVWRKHEEGELLDASDKRLQGNFEQDEMRRVMHTGLLCTHPDPKSRLPTRGVFQILMREMETPELPSSRPTAVYIQIETRKVYGSGILTSMASSSYTQTSSQLSHIQLSGPR
ncbi:hypothetical protein KP509_01G111200 [Ceratopteris richardii]|uniref:Protein kinase domain-containing protein n=1 Tax=Ceratopteris richardii TaxID=49495 RepID=A0A8T2VPB8_CERRI|nr:hypothetical protein KP509_01G111200 [Ceratopteris richardii]